MKTKLTKQQFLDLNPCGDALAFAKSIGFDPVKGWEKCERGDWLIWLLRKTSKLDKPTAVKIAIECAAHVLERYEKKNPKDLRPRQAIEAARKWLAEPTEENQAVCRKAAAAAYAADAAYTGVADAADARLTERK